MGRNRKVAPDRRHENAKSTIVYLILINKNKTLPIDQDLTMYRDLSGHVWVTLYDILVLFRYYHSWKLG